MPGKNRNIYIYIFKINLAVEQYRQPESNFAAGVVIFLSIAFLKIFLAGRGRHFVIAVYSSKGLKNIAGLILTSLWTKKTVAFLRIQVILD